jgi:integrase
MDERLTGHVEPYRRDGRTVRGRSRLVVNLPRVPRLDDAGQQLRDARGRPLWRYPTQSQVVFTSGVKDADAQLQRWIADLEQQRTRDPRRLTLGSLLDLWQKGTAHALKPKTRRFYRENVDLYITPKHGDKPALASLLCAEVKPSDLTRLYSELRAKSLSETTVRHVHDTLRACYSWAMAEEYLESSPCQRLKRRQVPTPRRSEVVTWDDGQIVEALRLAVERRKGRAPRPLYLVQVPLLLAGWSGLRAEEVSGLQRQDLDLEGCTLHVERVAYYVDGELYVGPPKSEAGIRDVPLPSQSVAVLREYLRAQDEMRLARRGRWNREGWVLCTRDGMPVDPGQLSGYWGRFVRSRELPHITLHGLRHSFATNVFDQVPEHRESMLKVVQELLGHADPAITARTYLHVTESASEDARSAQQKAIDAAELEDSRKIHARVADLSERRSAK